MNPVGQFQEHLNSSKGVRARGHALAIPVRCYVAGYTFSFHGSKCFWQDPRLWTSKMAAVSTGRIVTVLV